VHGRGEYLHALLHGTSGENLPQIIIGLVDSGHLLALIMDLLVCGNLLQRAVLHGEDVLSCPFLMQ